MRIKKIIERKKEKYIRKFRVAPAGGNPDSHALVGNAGARNAHQLFFFFFCKI